MTATQRLKQLYVLDPSTQTTTTLTTSMTEILQQIIFKCTTLYHCTIQGSLARSNSPPDHYFSGLQCKSYAQCIVKTNNKVDSSQAG